MGEQSNSRRDTERASSQLKAIIIERARKGALDYNPLLSTAHVLTCHQCKHRQSIVYLDCLKSGEFALGKTEQIEVLDSSGPIGFLEMEKVTPIVISLICEACGCRIEVRPVSVEYLQVIIDRPQASRAMYV
ncbi:MAG: hypothetical protein ACYS6K_16640 [Planctomycetota bacterium]|jgi:hypothetical protein